MWRSIPLWTFPLLGLGVCADPPAPLDPPPLFAGKTTESSVAVSNLDAGIQGSLSALEYKADDAPRARLLVETLLARAEFLGRPSDIATAEQAATRFQATMPDSALASWLRALAAAAAGDGNSVEGHLARARARGWSATDCDFLRASVRREAASDLRDPPVLVWARLPRELLGRALDARAENRHEEAIELFSETLRQHANPSPLPVAWILTATAELYRLQNKSQDAVRHLEAARKRLAPYVEAHLALAAEQSSHGRLTGPLRRLRSLLNTTQDPRIYALMSQMLARRSNRYDDERRGRDLKNSETFAQRAHEGLAWLQSHYPQRFRADLVELAAHIDPPQAVRLAEELWAGKTSERYLEAALHAARLAGDSGAGCQWRDRWGDRPIAPAVRKRFEKLGRCSSES